MVLSTLFETRPVGVTVLDPIRRANRRAEEVLDLAAADITGRTYNDPGCRIVDADGESLPDDDLPFVRVLRTGGPVFEYEHGIAWPGGMSRWLSINAAPLGEPGDPDAVKGVMAVITDITDRREHERTIERKNERLETFAGIVSHDLHNP